MGSSPPEARRRQPTLGETSQSREASRTPATVPPVVRTGYEHDAQRQPPHACRAEGRESDSTITLSPTHINTSTEHDGADTTMPNVVTKPENSKSVHFPSGDEHPNSRLEIGGPKQDSVLRYTETPEYYCKNPHGEPLSRTGRTPLPFLIRRNPTSTYSERSRLQHEVDHPDADEITQTSRLIASGHDGWVSKEINEFEHVNPSTSDEAMTMITPQSLMAICDVNGRGLATTPATSANDEKSLKVNDFDIQLAQLDRITTPRPSSLGNDDSEHAYAARATKASGKDALPAEGNVIIKLRTDSNTEAKSTNASPLSREDIDHALANIKNARTRDSLMKAQRTMLKHHNKATAWAALSRQKRRKIRQARRKQQPCSTPAQSKRQTLK